MSNIFVFIKIVHKVENNFFIKQKKNLNNYITVGLDDEWQKNKKRIYKLFNMS